MRDQSKRNLAEGSKINNFVIQHNRNYNEVYKIKELNNYLLIQVPDKDNTVDNLNKSNLNEKSAISDFDKHETSFDTMNKAISKN